MWPQFNTRREFHQRFPDEKSCIAYLEERRWKDKVVSPYDSSSKVYNIGNGNYRCSVTKKTFNVKTGTIFQGTKLPLVKWFETIYIMSLGSISSTKLAKEMGVRQATAWDIMHKIRKAYFFENNRKLDGEVELDETFVGGRNKNRHWDKKVPKSQGRSHHDKAKVWGAFERGENGKLLCRVVKDTNARTLFYHTIKFVKRTAKLYIDEWGGNNITKKYYKYGMVNHKKKEYVNGDAHTNGIENKWSILKRNIYGVHIKVSRKYLQLYLNEFVFRYNTCKLTVNERFDYFLENTLKS